MSTGPGDLAPLINPDRPQALGFRQGVIITWNQGTGSNTIRVGGAGGAVVADLPCINPLQVLSLTSGDVVGILTFGSTWFVLGRISVPGTAGADTGLEVLSDRTVTRTIPVAESTTSTSFVGLATPGPTVTVVVPSTARVLVLISAQISGSAFGGEMTFAVSGASTIPAVSARALRFQAPGAGLLGATFAVRLSTADGLVAGTNTFTAQYRASSGTATFTDRSLTVSTI